MEYTVLEPSLRQTHILAKAVLSRKWCGLIF